MHSKAAFFTNHKPFFCTSPSLSLSKATLFHHKRRKFAPSHNLLFAKNTAILLSSALNPYAVTPEPRTDSKPFRRRFVRKTGFGSCRQKYLQKYFRQSFESQVAGRSPVCFLVTFCTMQKVTTRSLCREHRGFPNLDSARRNGGFARTQLNPFAALRRLLFPTFCKAQKVGQKNSENFLSEILPCRDGTLRVLFPPPLSP